MFIGVLVIFVILIMLLVNLGESEFFIGYTAFMESRRIAGAQFKYLLRY